MRLSAGARHGPRYVLLYEIIGGGGNLLGSREWLWPERGDLPLQVGAAHILPPSMFKVQIVFDYLLKYLAQELFYSAFISHDTSVVIEVI